MSNFLIPKPIRLVGKVYAGQTIFCALFTSIFSKLAGCNKPSKLDLIVAFSSLYLLLNKLSTTGPTLTPNPATFTIGFSNH